MNKDKLFQSLQEEDTTTLLDLLHTAYDFLDHDQRERLFSRYIEVMPPSPIDGETLLADIKRFAVNSRDRHYYQPFLIDSKNFMHLPEKTKEWCREMGDFLRDSCQLTAQGDYQQAATCFRWLFELMQEMEHGEEIVFGDEIGSWLISVDEKQWLTAYITAISKTTTPDNFARTVAALARRDSQHSLTGEVYITACRVADAAQIDRLDEEIKRLNIRTGRWW